jgi:hypothetical protein
MRISIFLSSPGDVADERAFAQQVIEQELPKDPLLRGQVTCEAVRWDDPNAPVAMPATLTPQEAVNHGLPKPSQCDVVVVVLWSRLGTPLPDEYRKADGSPYLSGTEWEYDDALAASPPRHILVYRRTQKLSIDPSDPQAADKLGQYQRVQQFFERFRNPDGSLRGGYGEYDTPQAFRDRLRNDLRAYVQRRLAQETQDSARSPIKALPPFGEIGRALGKGRVVPFLGFCRSCNGRPADARWEPQAPRFLPSGVELSHFLADDVAFPENEDRDELSTVASYYEALQSRATLRERLRQVLASQASSHMAVPALHRLLAAVPVPLLIVSTLFDVQLERAFREAGRAYDLVVYPADRKDLANAVLWWPHGESQPRTPSPNELDIDLSTTTVIFKMHGSVHPETDEWDGFVITEQDHVEFLSRVASKVAIPSLLSAHMHDRSLLFIGCSLHDWNLRVMVRSLSRYFGRRTEDDEEISCWAINDKVSELEVQLWQRRGVYPFQLPIDEFVNRLRERMQL